jgi:hypothetical protein
MSHFHFKKKRAVVVTPGDDLVNVEHNYCQKLFRMNETGGLAAGAGLYNVYIRHDRWCGALQGGRCDCDPAIDAVPYDRGDNNSNHG